MIIFLLYQEESERKRLVEQQQMRENASEQHWTRERVQNSAHTWEHEQEQKQRQESRRATERDRNLASEQEQDRERERMAHESMRFGEMDVHEMREVCVYTFDTLHFKQKELHES